MLPGYDGVFIIFAHARRKSLTLLLLSIANVKQSMEPRVSGILSVVLIAAGLVTTVAGFYLYAEGGTFMVFIAGIVVLVAGCVLSYLDIHGFFDGTGKKKEPVSKRDNNGSDSKRRSH